MASDEPRNEKPTTQENVAKTLHKTKTKCDFEETGNRSQSNCLRAAFSRFRCNSQTMTVTIKDTADGAILDLYPMDRGGQLYIIRTYVIFVH